MALALFDFDGTITYEDTFAPFIRYAVPTGRILAGAAALSPLLLGYELGLVRATSVRAAIVYAGLKGRNEAEVRVLGKRYAERLPGFVRAEALARIQWHQQKSDTVVVVSASLSPYLSAWCNSLGIELICSELESRNGLMTGRYAGGDCTGPEKANRVRARYQLTSYETVYAYGDTEEDRELLALASEPYFRWQRVAKGAR
jgi:HAD superfamily hydrolase (TIGR01490 family)